MTNTELVRDQSMKCEQSRNKLHLVFVFIQGKAQAAQKMTEQAAMVLEKQSQRRIGLKSANDFIRSSQAQQEERRQRMRKQAQKHAKKLAATQKTGKPNQKAKQKKPTAKESETQS